MSVLHSLGSEWLLLLTYFKFLMMPILGFLECEWLLYYLILSLLIMLSTGCKWLLYISAIQVC